MFDFLTRGPLMIAPSGGDGGGGAAVADAGGDFGGSGADTGVDAGDGTDGTVHDAEFADPGTDVAVRSAESGAPAIKPGEHIVQNGRFSASGKAVVEALRPLGQRAVNEVTQALLTREWLRKELPGGKGELSRLRQLAEQHGGEQGLQELSQVADTYNELDGYFVESDPRFVEAITQSEEGKNGLIGLMEPLMAKFSQLAPEMFAYQNARNFSHFMDTARLPVKFDSMAAILNRAIQAQKSGNNELAASFLNEIVNGYNEIADTFDRVYAAAKNRPELRKSSNPDLDRRSQELSEREKQLQRQEWSAAVSNERKRVFSRAWSELTKGRTLTKDQESDIKGFYELAMNAKTRGWQNSADRFIANGDRDGYIKEQFGFFSRAIPDALRHAMAKALPAKPGPKSNGNGPVRPPVSRGTAAPAAGAIRVSKMPSASQLDAVRTTADLLSQNKAYGRDGKLYQWA